MLFNSLEFAIFFCIVTLLYYLVPHRTRWVLLLAASCHFYTVLFPIYILILVFTIVVDYGAGLLIERSRGKQRTLFLAASLCANLGVLAFFKYYNFLNNSLTAVLGLGSLANPISNLNIILPIGLSFHTFQAMSYTIEVYRGHQRAERHFGLYALYVMFYPQLVAGPIERPQNLLHQFREVHKFNYVGVTSGLRLMAWGLFKKVVVADRLADLVNHVYASPGQYSGVEVALGTLFFAYQIYCDFSGYSDMAVGAARVMGFDLARNFNLPYLAANIQEFWRRWHISLSTWFRDYLYFPLGGSRVADARMCFNILVVFAVSGLWHGANWTYVIWGLIHGVLMLAFLLTRKVVGCGSVHESRPWELLSRGGTFICVCLAWVFFRADDLPTALVCLRKMSGAVGDVTQFFLHGSSVVATLDTSKVIWGLILIGGLEALQLGQIRFALSDRLRRSPWFCRWPVYYAAIALIYFGGVFGNHAFVYFQF